MVAVTAAPGSIFSRHFPSKSKGLGEGKENPVPEGAVQTDLSSVGEEDPWSGRIFEPTQGQKPRVRTELRGGSGASASCPLGGAAPLRPPPPLALRSQPRRQRPGNPQLDFFVQFQQSSEEVGPFVPLFIDCVNIAKRRRRSGGPSPSSHRLQREKSPSTRPKYTAR